MIRRLLRRLLGFPSLRTLSSQDAYAQWAAAYPPHAHNALMEAEEATMRQLMPELRHQMVLDLACGTGRYGLLAQEQGARVVGLDNSAAMLRRNPLPLLVLSSAEAIPLASGCIDVVLCALALGHLPALEASMREISRVLKPGGCALISDFHPFMFLSGGRRTFKAADGTAYAVEHYVHLYSDFQRAAGRSGLQIESVVEPRLETPGQPAPVVIVYAVRKQA